ncbi:hypothetical protein [Caballeronia sp. BR00000012568055]|uniref:hypothetical protein n=1 Tax=Caballeronia sp. BR00000012568055 TaxID=2918761 RepID=UPI0023F7A6F8|nr:hypothetical protein [Caballeronia sp. BR00000012568055]
MPLLPYAPAVSRRKPATRTQSALRAEIAYRFASATTPRVTRFGRIYPGGSRYVCVCARNESGVFALYFFHHGAHDWRTYPPRGVGPSIVYWSVGSSARSAKAAPG